MEKSDRNGELTFNPRHLSETKVTEEEMCVEK